MNKTSYSNRARSLQYESERNERRRLLFEPYMKPLTEFVETLRRHKGPQFDIPYFDPCDGGVEALLLTIGEAPGPMAKKSGFISRNNNDETAENMNRILKKSGLKREDTILWNIVPWYLGDGKHIRKPTPAEISEGIRHLSELLQLLPNLRAIVLVGEKAQSAQNAMSFPQEIKIFESPHPSPLNINFREEAEGEIIQVLTEAKEYIHYLGI